MGLRKSKNITAARRTLQKWMGKYVRIRDCDPDTHEIECITCGTSAKYGEGQMNAGHFIEAEIDATRANEYNVNAQCVACNQKGNGLAGLHGKAIQLKYGEDVYEELLTLAKKDITLSIEETMQKAREYKQRAIQLAEEKGIEL